jgi:predicted component of type VI protein secretion system
MHFTILRPQKKNKPSPVKMRLYDLPAQSAFSSALWSKTHLKKLGFGLGQDLTIIGV